MTTGTASAEVLAAAKPLSEQSNRLKTEVGKFLATVHAARRALRVKSRLSKYRYDSSQVT